MNYKEKIKGTIKRKTMTDIKENVSEAVKATKSLLKILEKLEKSMEPDVELFPSCEPKKDSTATITAKLVILHLSEKLLMLNLIKIKLKPTYSRLQLVKARLKESSYEECVKMIDSQFTKWLNTDYQKYLRIETLFKASKFQGYVESIVKPKEGFVTNGQNSHSSEMDW